MHIPYYYLHEKYNMTKLISFYLPQFHPIPENDEWWGKGFTEWSNVVTAEPRFSGHNQPHLPTDLGFYDLRLPEIRQQQADMAKEYGLDGFCYYHYWFNGKELLDRPLKEVVSSSKPDFPFCICWANENWTRAWDGLEREVLIKQDYSSDDSRKHFTSLLSTISDNRYIQLDGRPIILIYRPDNIPDPKSYFNQWREWAVKEGLNGLYICAVKNGFTKCTEVELIDMGFDSIVDFQPNRSDFPVASTLSQGVVDFLRKVLPDRLFQILKNNTSAVNKIDYKKLVKKKTAQEWVVKYKKFPSVFPSWDNTARRKTPTVIQNDDPKYFSEWLNFSVDAVKKYPEDERVVFINAWNEWAEGCHLEPDKKNGFKFLDVVKSVKKIINT